MMIIDGTLAPTLALLHAIADPALRLRAFTGAIVAQGGTIVLPPDDNTWGPHLFELSLFGILGTGTTGQEAMAEWMACAARQIEAEVMVRTTPKQASTDDLHAACLAVRTRSQDCATIEQGARLERALASGWMA